jgi:tetraacyldisaccharide 4'-kinase
MKFRRLLWPISIVYGAGQRIDRMQKRSGAYGSALPVISVGNLTVGGSGKTPLALFLIERLQRLHGMVVLSRGYGRTAHDRILWRAGEPLPDPRMIGDEPALIARRLRRGALAIAADRASMLRSIEGEFPGHIALLDDGFQHYRLARDLDIVIVDDRTVRNARLLPAGDLREPPSALARAQVVAATSAEAKEFAYKWKSESALLLGMRTVMKRIVRWADVGDHYDGGPALLITGIAEPERVLAGLGEKGDGIVGHMRFGDHHLYSHADVERIAAEARSKGARSILTTAKDAVKLAAFRELDELLYVIEIDVAIDREERLFDAISVAVRSKSINNA